MLAIALALLLSRRWQPDVLADTRWAPLLLTVGAAGGFARVLDETGMAELLAEYVLDPRLGLLAPFLAAATVKTLQGNSLSAVLTASGIVEPMLPALGLDSATGRALAAASVGAGSIAICHVNDPFFWIAAHMAGLSPARPCALVSLGSLAVAVVGARRARRCCGRVLLVELHAGGLDGRRPGLAVGGEELLEAGAAGRRHVEAEIVLPALLDLGLASASATAASSLATIGSGVPAGAPTPYHEVAT